MSDHSVVYVDRLVRPVPEIPVQAETEKSGFAGSSRSASPEKFIRDGGEEEPLVQSAECRICQEEDSLENLESPCACSGSLKYAHRKCVQHWCNEKGDIICEICHQPYQSGYTVPPPRPQLEETTIDFGRGWTISGTPSDMYDPRVLAIAEHQFMEADYAASQATGATFYRSAVLIFMALLLLRHAMIITDGGDEDNDDDDMSSFFSLFLLRVAGFLLPCYIMAWAISYMQRRRQRQEAAALARQMAFVLRSGHHRAGGVRFTMAPTPYMSEHHETV